MGAADSTACTGGVAKGVLRVIPFFKWSFMIFSSSTTIDKHGSPTCFDAVRVRLTIPEATRTLD